ncbi:uncharacterized protein [Halyomorpha halys]|uniref:uncharacterized protein isoform X2 n=1 Tax=Halyomorpha halys TaxID=286706 RepID=UPI0006D4E8E4|nr:uncharacterized protein LOC106689557 isoform X2 [Halyomorpha halys]
MSLITFLNLSKIYIYLGGLMTTFVTAQDIENERSLSSYEELLKKLSDEIRRQEIEKRDKVRLLEYLQQAIKDKQIELRLENEELKSRYAELNKTRHYVESPFPDINLYDDSSEEEIICFKIKELEGKINMLQTYNTPYPNPYANQQYIYPQPFGTHNNRAEQLSPLSIFQPSSHPKTDFSVPNSLQLKKDNINKIKIVILGWYHYLNT